MDLGLTFKQRIKIGWWPVALLAACSCISGPKTKNKPLAEKFNGHSYESSNSVSGIPVVKRKGETTSIKGIVSCGQGLQSRPAPGAIVKIFVNNVAKDTVTSAPDGRFTSAVRYGPQDALKVWAESHCGMTIEEVADHSVTSNLELRLK